MADSQNPVFCDNIGDTSRDLRCCFLNNQTLQVCRDNLHPGAGTFDQPFRDRPPLQYCQRPAFIYFSKSQNNGLNGNGALPRNRFSTCVNVPNMARYLDQDVLDPDISSEVGQYISRKASEEDLRHITAAVTDCLTATCRNARHKAKCSFQCSGVNLLINGTTPNVTGIDLCLKTLCDGGYDSLPYADLDVVGIGVLSSYIMQCSLLVILFFGFTGLDLFKCLKSKRALTADVSPAVSDGEAKVRDDDTHHGKFSKLLDQFHESQCYFSGTIQIAALSYGIFDVDMLNTFLLMPLASNGVLPVTFAYIILLHRDRASLGMTILTLCCWILSSLVFWILYSHLIPLNSDFDDPNKEYRAYEQFMYKLSALDACGRYSALAACPNQVELGRGAIYHASHKLRVLTPIIWSFSTACLLVAVVEKIVRTFRTHDKDNHEPEHVAASSANNEVIVEQANETKALAKPMNTIFKNRIVYGIVSLGFLAGVGMQLSLFSVSLSLQMTDGDRWTFGQIVAVTIWFPPFITWIFGELNTLRPHALKNKNLGGIKTRKKAALERGVSEAHHGF